MYYGVELADVYLRKVSFRKVGVYLSHLPPESATMTAIRVSIPEDQIGSDAPDPTKSKWSASEMLMAQLIDEIRVLRYIVTCFASSKGTTVPKPESVPRPGVKSSRSGAKQDRKLYTREQILKLDPRLRRESA